MNKEKKEFTSEDATRAALNSINNDRLIKIGNNWVFTFLKEDFQSSPVTPHHFSSCDLSVNIRLELKWAPYGWFFLKSIWETLDDKNYLDEVSSPDALNPNYENLKYDKKLFFNYAEVGSVDLLKNKLENGCYKTTSNENLLVSFKLKLNVSEFIAVQSTLFPVISEIILN